MRFTQRMGLAPVQKLVQRDSLDDDLRNSLWSIVTLVYWEQIDYKAGHYGTIKHSNVEDLISALWMSFFKQPIDTIPKYFSDTLETLRSWYFSASWGEVYDFIEFCADYGFDKSKKDFIKFVNVYLERENSAYRFVSGKLTEIASQVEIDSVENAIRLPYENVRAHLESALNLMNNKVNPDYRNSIKESISAVEAAARHVVKDDKATLGQALNVLEKNGNLHKALKSAFTSLYGYTSDAEGIRHALLEESSLKKSDARFMLVSCSSFVNYLLELSQPATN